MVLVLRHQFVGVNRLPRSNVGMVSVEKRRLIVHPKSSVPLVLLFALTLQVALLIARCVPNPSLVLQDIPAAQQVCVLWLWPIVPLPPLVLKVRSFVERMEVAKQIELSVLLNIFAMPQRAPDIVAVMVFASIQAISVLKALPVCQDS